MYKINLFRVLISRTLVGFQTCFIFCDIKKLNRMKLLWLFFISVQIPPEHSLNSTKTLSGEQISLAQNFQSFNFAVPFCHMCACQIATRLSEWKLLKTFYRIVCSLQSWHHYNNFCNILSLSTQVASASSASAVKGSVLSRREILFSCYIVITFTRLCLKLFKTNKKRWQKIGRDPKEKEMKPQPVYERKDSSRDAVKGKICKARRNYCYGGECRRLVATVV